MLLPKKPRDPGQVGLVKASFYNVNTENEGNLRDVVVARTSHGQLVFFSPHLPDDHECQTIGVRDDGNGAYFGFWLKKIDDEELSGKCCMQCVDPGRCSKRIMRLMRADGPDQENQGAGRQAAMSELGK